MIARITSFDSEGREFESLGARHPQTFKDARNYWPSLRSD